MKVKTANLKSRGRPRGFDAEKALDAAMKVFRKHGYEGTSLDDLTTAMGINRPSLYSAFGNKESLFQKVLNRYGEQSGGMMCVAMNQPTARGVVEHLLRGAIPKSSRNAANGCLLVQGALACGEESESVRRDLVKRRCAVETALAERFERAVKEGDLSKSENPAALAKYIVTIQHGLSVQVASGANAEVLRDAVEIALRAWPSN